MKPYFFSDQFELPHETWKQWTGALLNVMLLFCVKTIIKEQFWTILSEGGGGRGGGADYNYDNDYNYNYNYDYDYSPGIKKIVSHINTPG